MSIHRVLTRRITTLSTMLALALVAAIPTASHAAPPSTTVPTMGALADCTVSASKPVRQGFRTPSGTWISDGVVGTASVTGCPTNRSITVYVTIQRTNGGSYNGSYTCPNARSCSAWIGQSYTSGRWTTFGSSNQTGNTLAVSAYADL